LHNELRTAKDKVLILTEKNAKIVKEKQDLENELDTISEALKRKKESVKYLKRLFNFNKYFHILAVHLNFRIF